MRLRRRTPEFGLPGVEGPARSVRPAGDATLATRALARRIDPGDVAVIDHLDLDRVTAESLVAARPVAVVNVRSTLSGRYPARGAGVLVAAGIPVVDAVGTGVLSDVHDGERLRVDHGRVYAGADRLLGQGAVLTTAGVDAVLERARTGMSGRLAALGSEAADFLTAHEGLLLEGAGLPTTTTTFAGRTVLVVAPGERAAAEVRMLRRWVRDTRPVVVAAEAGAVSVLAAGLRPHVVVGDPGTINPADGQPLTRAETVALDAVPDGLSATDLAVLIALTGEAELAVLAGAPATFEELLDGDRSASAGQLAVRLRAGDRLVDASAVAVLARPTVGWAAPLLLLVAGIAALVVALAAVPGGHLLVDRLRAVLPW